MGLTQVATVDIDNMEGLVLNDGTKTFELNNDQHFVGSLISTIGTTYYYRTILNCTETLVIALKNAGLFQKTLIHFGSEFNRNARVDGSGSDHGFKGSSTLLISGMIKETTVVGNIYKTDPAREYAGTWGLAAPHPINAINGRSTTPIRLNDVILTVCAMLGLPNVSANGKAVLRSPDGLTWSAHADSKKEAKNV